MARMCCCVPPHVPTALSKDCSRTALVGLTGVWIVIGPATHMQGISLALALINPGAVRDDCDGEIAAGAYCSTLWRR